MSITFNGDLNTISSSNTSLSFNAQGFVIPMGNTLQRPSSPVSGTVRFNTQTNKLEGYNGTGWTNVGVA